MADLTPLIDLAVRRQVLLERIKSGQIRSFQAAFREIEGIVRSAFIKLENDLTDSTKRQVDRFVAKLRKDVQKAYNSQLKLFTAELEETAGVFAAAEAVDLTKAIVNLGSLNIPNRKKVIKAAFEKPMSHSGETLNEFIETFADREARRVANVVRQGVIHGSTNQELVRTIRGTQARKFKDGILQTSKRNAEAVIRTSTQHVAGSARQELWGANKDVVEKYQWVSTLDRKTTQVCKTLDGKQYELGKGPTPPIHINCRSSTIAVPKPEFEFLSQGRTRSAEFGPVDGKETYYDWLKRQNQSVQVEALGPARAKLFRDGGLTTNEFSKLQLDRAFQPLTLDEMRALEPEAFKKAGLGPKG